MITIRRFFACLLTSLFTTTLLADSGLKVTDARIMITPPGVSVTAGLMSLVNETDADIEVISISAKGFERVEMHQTQVVDGVAKMRAAQHLNVPAGGTLVLENGGYHMMLYTPERSFTVGDNIDITITTNHGRMTASVPVKRHFAN